MTLPEILGHLAYILTMTAFIVKDIFYLRLFAIIAGLTAVFYGFLHIPEPLWVDIFWRAVFSMINGVHLFILLRERRTLTLTDEEKKLHSVMFKHVSLLKFRKLMNSANFVSAEKGECLTEEGKHVQRLVLLTEGVAEVSRGGDILAYVKAGSLVGEMSFISGEPATATVRALEPLRYAMWVQADLQKLIASDHSLQNAMQSIFTKDLVKKLSKT